MSDNYNYTNWHQLAKERSTSQDSVSQQSDSDSSWSDVPRKSEMNLSLTRRQTHQDIRKSTLMKRFWESSRNLQSPASFPSSFTEWRHSKKGSSSQVSLDSPKHGRIPQTQRRLEIPKAEEDSYVVYSSTENTARTDVTDPYPSTSESIDKVRESEQTKSYRINDTGISETSQNDLPRLPIKYQFEIDENSKTRKPEIPEKRTNLNVITNVELSQSTLNMIFNQVMQDVLQKPLTNPEVVDDHIVKQKAFNWNLNLEPEDSQLPEDSHKEPEELPKEVPKELKPEEEVISQINIGSPYRNKATVLRLSALPKTTSMEVNTSSNDSFDKDSDNSLVDSLDDPSSPRFKVKQTKVNITKERTRDDKGIQEKEVIKKSSVFYIPIDDSKTGSDNQVSNLLPSKLKEKLVQRQLKREEKRLQEKLKSFDFENGNISGYFSTSPELTSSTSKKTPRTFRKPNTTKKTTLPQIDPGKDYTKNLKTHRSIQTKKTVLPKSNTKPQEIKKSKKIEILEIMEIVDPDRSAKKSKIPVLQHSGGSGTKLPKLRPKPTFLDFGEVGQPGDPKLDQLIANILIDTLNHEDIKDAKTINDSEQRNNNVSLIEEAADILTKQVLGNNNLSATKPSEEMPVTNPEEIPKGWVTFYMLQKTQSPESTSDEGKNGRDNEQCEAKSRKKLRLRRKPADRQDQARSTRQDGWSVTFNNNGKCEDAPEVEMKVKFPTLSSKKSDDKTERSSGLNFEDICNASSEIQKSKRYLENPRNIKLRRRQIILSPRATKTSRQRSLLNRQKHFDHEDLPQVLSISGSGLHQIRRLPRLSESVLHKLLQCLQQEQENKGAK